MWVILKLEAGKEALCLRKGKGYFGGVGGESVLASQGKRPACLPQGRPVCRGKVVG